MRAPRRARIAALAFATVGLACGDAPAAPSAKLETVLVSLHGVASDAAGIVLRLTGTVDDIEIADATLELAWARDGDATTVGVLGAFTDGADVLVVKRRSYGDVLRAEVREVASADGVVSSPPGTRALVRITAAP